MQFYTVTDCGKTRPNNEDFCCGEVINGFTVLILADGMGGYQGGEIASSGAVGTVIEYLRKNLQKYSSPKQIFEAMHAALYYANKNLFNMANESATLEGMGTTIDIVISSNHDLFIAHVGDGRVYKISEGGKIRKITRDHSLVQYMLERGEITPQEAAVHPQRHVITRALGTDYTINADMITENFTSKDTLLLCSDGLTGMLSDEKILSIVTESTDLGEAAQTLVRLANEAGGKDNITVIIARLEEE